jgi:hypothetical protein
MLRNAIQQITIAISAGVSFHSVPLNIGNYPQAVIDDVIPMAGINQHGVPQAT